MHNEHPMLAWIERVGNRLPHPVTLFCFAAFAVMVLSQLAALLEWQVTKTVTGSDGAQRQELVEAVGLLDSDGIWWVLSHAVQNFMNFPPLGLVLVAMLGIGVAEHSGLIAAVIRGSIKRTPRKLLVPAVFFLGVMSSMTLDAGYVVLPPLAAMLFLAMGYSPLVGIAAAFAGVSAGFSANLFITAIDPMMAGLSEAAANLLDEGYQVSATSNWWFMIASTLVLTITGWWVTSQWVAPRFTDEIEIDHAMNDPQYDHEGPSGLDVRRGLRWALWSVVISIAVVLLFVFIPGAPLYGGGNRFDRWIEAIVPVIFVLFILPGIAYGFGAKTVRSEKDVAGLMSKTMADLGPYIVMAFFAAQFIAFFKYSNLGEMLAIVGGQALAAADFSPLLLMVTFTLIVMVGNLFIGSASAKYAFFAPVFVPMFMQVGISPELTQAAYRVGDSVTNVITPLNPYMVIVLAFMQRYVPTAGFGTLIALMLPYAIAFAVVWIVMLMIWVAFSLPLGPAGPLWYPFN